MTDVSPAQGGDVRDRVEFDRGELDEIVSSKGAHLENLGDGRWYLAFQHGDGSETVVRFTSRDLRTPTIEKREPRQGWKLTKVRKQALEWFRDHDGAKLFPSFIQRRAINDLVNAGLLRVERPKFGFAPHYITDAGRKALEDHGK